MRVQEPCSLFLHPLHRVFSCPLRPSRSELFLQAFRLSLPVSRLSHTRSRRLAPEIPLSTLVAVDRRTAFGSVRRRCTKALTKQPMGNGRAWENPGRHRHFVFSRLGLAFTAAQCIAWQVARDRWHLLERARLCFHRQKRSVPSKARPTMLAFTSYRKGGSASYIVREELSVRERERDTDRERRKWRNHCRAKIGDEFPLSLAKISHNWRWAYTFPCQKFALFISPFTLPISPFTERSPLWSWNSQRVHTFRCRKFFALFVPPLSNGTSRTTSDRKPKTNYQILPSPILFFPSKSWIKLIPKTSGNRKRDCAWGGSGW